MLSCICLFFPTGEPKIGVHLLNSGGKKLYVKVGFLFILLVHSLCGNCSVSYKMFLSFQEMQVLSKVEVSLEFNQVPLRPEAKNFTEVATLACRGDYFNF